MSYAYKDGKLTIEMDGLDTSILADIAKISGVLAAGVGCAAAVGAGGSAAAVTAAGVVGAGAVAYAATDAIEEHPERVQHEAPIAIESYDFSEANMGGNHSSDSLPSPSTAKIDPAIAKALSNYHDMKGVMQQMGFIAEDVTEISSPNRYGCPAPSMARSTSFRSV